MSTITLKELQCKEPLYESQGVGYEKLHATLVLNIGKKTWKCPVILQNGNMKVLPTKEMRPLAALAAVGDLEQTEEWKDVVKEAFKKLRAKIYAQGWAAMLCRELPAALPGAVVTRPESMVDYISGLVPYTRCRISGKNGKDEGTIEASILHSNCAIIQKHINGHLQRHNTSPNSYLALLQGMKNAWKRFQKKIRADISNDPDQDCPQMLE
jgi:hypothetical protein